MRIRFIIASISIVFLGMGQALAHDEHDSRTGQGKMMEYLHSKKDSMKEQAKEPADHSGMTRVGNRICPVSGEWIPEGKNVEYEYKGRIYNLCCKMCAKDFKKDPEKFAGIAEEMMLKEHGSVHEEQESAGHRHKALGLPAGRMSMAGGEPEGPNHGEHAHQCEGAGCAE